MPSSRRNSRRQFDSSRIKNKVNNSPRIACRVILTVSLALRNLRNLLLSPVMLFPPPLRRCSRLAVLPEWSHRIKIAGRKELINFVLNSMSRISFRVRSFWYSVTKLSRLALAAESIFAFSYQNHSPDCGKRKLICTPLKFDLCQQ